MNAYNVQKWNRSLEIASDFDVMVEVKSNFRLYKSTGEMLGAFETVDELYAYLCGRAAALLGTTFLP